MPEFRSGRGNVGYNGQGSQRRHQTRIGPKLIEKELPTQTFRSIHSNNSSGETRNWINQRTGQPYSGPVHYHEGRAMEGARHSSTPHDYLTPAKTNGGMDAPPMIERKRARKRRKVRRTPRRGRDNL
jgi:hypothetical protein